MKKGILDDIKMSIAGRDVEVVLVGDNTRDGGTEAYNAAEVIKQLFMDNDRYDTLTFKVVDCKDPDRLLWCFKLQLHRSKENLVLDMIGGEFLAGIPDYSE